MSQINTSPIRNGELLTVTIHLEQDIRPDGTTETHITYRPAVLSVGKGDSITWRCDDGAFDIVFSGLTPVAKTSISAGRGMSSKPAGVSDVRGRYPYAVVVRTEDKIYIDAGCPQILIDY